MRCHARRHLTLFMGATALCGSWTGVATAEGALPSPTESVAGCPSAHDFPAFTFQGSRLRETPDIDNPQLRLASAALSEHCFEWVDGLLERYTTNYPDDFHVAFLRARQAWVLNNRMRAQLLVESVLRYHPGFTSAKVLRASMKELLDAIQKEQPEDLWAFIDRLRMEAQLAPSTELTATLRAIVRDDRFPPNARQQAAQTARFEQRGVSQDTRDALFTDQMRANPAFAGCNLAMQALDVIELRLDPKAGAALIEKYLRRSPECEGTPLVHTLLAEAYLWQASKIAPTPVPANAALIGKAKKTLRGDLTSVAHRASFRPFLNPLFPLLKGAVDLRQTDENGYTVLCNAVMALNAPAVEAVLDQGADLSAPCNDYSPVHGVLFTATSEKVRERQAVLRVLLEHGAPVEGLEFCASRDNGDCRDVLLPLLQEFQQRESRDRPSI